MHIFRGKSASLSKQTNGRAASEAGCSASGAGAPGMFAVAAIPENVPPAASSSDGAPNSAISPRSSVRLNASAVENQSISMCALLPPPIGSYNNT